MAAELVVIAAITVQAASKFVPSEKWHKFLLLIMFLMFQAATLFKLLVETLCNTEVKFVAVERIIDYLKIPSEVSQALKVVT